ncbi:Entericidin A/B family lipoprotein [Candidatus Bealeia paramacronuclearis]|uniref:Entericidin A/B family lipoprotein n=1 Tax=Candidatus Bealeia paramacronuclearis TaxID=1921001 RepID=A0ABZ2C2U1_9PROT|nr:Entericidin A/B family lipoprotein [Candidatus Bealeia paramacronuclearis]
MFKFLTLFLILGATLSGCNTTRGVGEDIQTVGKGIERATE